MVVNVVAKTFIRMIPIMANTNRPSCPITPNKGELLNTEIHSPCNKSLTLL